MNRAAPIGHTQNRSLARGCPDAARKGNIAQGIGRHAPPAIQFALTVAKSGKGLAGKDGNGFSQRCFKHKGLTIGQMQGFQP